MDVPGLTPETQENPLKADPSAQLRLLDVQELDAKIDALAHQRKNLPEIAEHAAAQQRRKELDDLTRDLQVTVSDLTSEQQRADRDVEQVKTRRKRDRDRMDQGLISDPKALERMSHELESLERRISTLEDEELEVMARLEDAERDLAQATADLAGVDQQLAALVAGLTEKTAVIDNDATALRSERAATVEGLPADLVALYEKVRASKGGVGAAELRRGACGGCRLDINTIELRDIAAAPADDVIRCEECQRILVRTAQSGLAQPG